MRLQYLALASLIVLYSLMFIGGYVSASGLGLSCPEWPLCPNGVLPDYDFLIEWTHRFIAATTGSLIVATTIGVWLNKRSDRKIKLTSTLASVFVVTQITLGAIVIEAKLHAVLVAIHLGIGILLFAMTLLTVLFAFRMARTIQTTV
ncbi:MAG: COX15/CtaA family protein [Candidatus Nitrosotenuis sp.]